MLSDAQRRYMDLLRRSGSPQKVPTLTARALRAKGFILPVSGGFVLSKDGRAFMEAEDRERAFRATEKRFAPETRVRAERVAQWLQAHARFAHMTNDWRAYIYARHVARAFMSGEEPAQPTGKWSPASIQAVWSETRQAIEALDLYDEQSASARKGEEVIVTYARRRRDSVRFRSKAEAVKDATLRPGVVRLGDYRLNRPHHPFPPGPRRPGGAA